MLTVLVQGNCKQGDINLLLQVYCIDNQYTSTTNKNNLTIFNMPRWQNHLLYDVLLHSFKILDCRLHFMLKGMKLFLQEILWNCNVIFNFKWSRARTVPFTCVCSWSHWCLAEEADEEASSSLCFLPLLTCALPLGKRDNSGEQRVKGKGGTVRPEGPAEPGGDCSSRFLLRYETHHHWRSLSWLVSRLACSLN